VWGELDSPIIRFKAKLLRPQSAKGGTWTFLVLPKGASARLPSRGLNAVAGSLDGAPFRATLHPDGQKSHWLKVNRSLQAAAGADVGEVLTLAITARTQPLQVRMPADLRKALGCVPKARAVWMQITPVARRDWIFWITSAKQAKTRARRVENACAMLASGKRRVCCFDRSGFYSKGFSAPAAARSVPAPVDVSRKSASAPDRA
jgi:hypothetical protein